MYTVKTLRSSEGNAPQVSIDYEDREITETDQVQTEVEQNVSVTVGNQPAAFQTGEGSYVSLLANIATVDRSDGYQLRDPGINSSMINYGNVSYATLCSNSETALAADSVINDPSNFVSFENITYVSNQGDCVGDDANKYMIIPIPQPSGDLDHGDSNAELQTAVANIRSQVDGDPQDTGNILIASTENGTLHPVQIGANGTVHVVTDIINTPNDLDLGNYKPIYDVAEKTFDNNKETKSTNVRVQKFTPAELNIMGRSEKEILTDYLEKTKSKRGRPKRGIVKEHEVSCETESVINTDACTSNTVEEIKEADKSQMGSDTSTNICSVLTSLPDKCTVDGTNQKYDEQPQVKPKYDSGESETPVDVMRYKNVDCSVKSSDKSEGCDFKDDIILTRKSIDAASEKAIVQDQKNDTSEQRRSCRKRKVTEKLLQAAESDSKIKRKSKKKETENEKQTDKEGGPDAEGRFDTEFFKKEIFKDKCVISLAPITLKSVKIKEYVIEVEVADDLCVSELSRSIANSGRSKFSFSVVKPAAIPVKPKTKEKESKSTSKQTLLKSDRTKRKKKGISKVANLKQKESKKTKSCNTNSVPLSPKIVGTDVKSEPEEDPKAPKVEPQDESSVDISLPVHSEEIDSEKIEDNQDFLDEDKTDPLTTEMQESVNSSDNIQVLGDVKETADQVEDNSTESRTLRKPGSGKSAKKQTPAKKLKASGKNMTAVKSYTTRITEDGKKEYGCPICGHTTRYSQNAQTHIAEHSDVKDFICEECGLCFKSKNRLSKHMIVHKRDRPFTCPLCPQTFKSKPMYICIICGHETRIKRNMNIHSYQHTDERPYQCEVCGQTFKGPSNLHAHKRQHMDIKRYNCPLCNKSFRDRGTFRQHTRRHMGDKRHVCEHCGKSFVLSTDLRKHIRVHTGEKPYKCNVCGKSFSDGSGMVRHQRMHTRKTRFQCCACNKLFTRKDLCNCHIKKIHSDLGPVNVVEVNISDDFTKAENDQKNLLSTIKHTNNQSKAKKTFPPKKSWQNFDRLTEEATKRLQDPAMQTYSPQPGEFQQPRNPNLHMQHYMNLPHSMQGYSIPTQYYQEHNQVLPYHHEPVQNL